MIKQRFNDGWLYKKGSGLKTEWKPGDAPVAVTLPHDAVILEPHDLVGDSRSNNFFASTGFYPSFNLNYTKSFFVPEDDRGKEIILDFEGVYMNASVFINNSFAGKNANGYTGFYVNASDYLNYGKENTILVSVKNEMPSTRWYTGGGIYRDVNILKGDKLHIKPSGVKIKTESIDGDIAVICIDTEIENKSVNRRKLKLTSEITDNNGNVCASDTATITIMSGETMKIRQRVTVENPLLWNVDTPNLYSCNSQIIENNVITDEIVNRFGIRILSLDRIRGLRINGERVMLRGGCIHHDNGIIGAISLPNAEIRRIKKLKEAGYNAIRSAHNPISRALLDACDSLGMLVMDELTDSWNRPCAEYDYGFFINEFWEKDVESMVNRDYNHPSVILYSIGNELPECGNAIDARLGLEITNKIKELDNTRFTLNSINHIMIMMNLTKEQSMQMAKAREQTATANMKKTDAAPTDVNVAMNQMHGMFDMMKRHPLASELTEETCSYIDISGYNYAAERYDGDLKQFPNRIIVGSETYPADLDINWEYVKNNPAILGDFSWTAWEYLGESGIGHIRYDADVFGEVYSSKYCLTAGCGDIDLIGDRQAVSLWRETVWGLSKKPYIVVLEPSKYGQKHTTTKWSFSAAIPTWSFADAEGQPTEVEVYADADEIELLINNQSVGRKKVGETKKCIAKFDVVYEKGRIEAIAYKNGEEISRNYLCSVEGETNLTATLHSSSIGYNDIAYIDISFVDKNGTIDTSNVSKVKIEIDGVGVLQGFGSADAYSLENFYDAERTAYRGRLLAAVRSRNTIGNINVKIIAEDYEPLSLCIKVVDKV